MPSKARACARRWSAGLLIGACLLLAGCGYQLKGQFGFAEGLDPLVWQEDRDAEELYFALRETFALYGLVLAREPAEVRLHLHDFERTEVALSDATVIGLRVEWSLVNAYGEWLINRQSLRAETRLSLSPVVDPEEAREERRAFLRQRIALRIMDQLEAIDEDDLARQPEEPAS